VEEQAMSRMGTMLKAGKALGDIQRSGIVSHPLLKMAMRYWWLSIPTGLALYSRIKENHAKGNKKVHHYFGAAAEVLGPVMTIVAVAEMASKMNREGRLDAHIDQRLQAHMAAQQTGEPAPATSRLHGDVISPPYVEDTPHPSLQRASL
jgi:hypothetical protein